MFYRNPSKPVVDVFVAQNPVQFSVQRTKWLNELLLVCKCFCFFFELFFLCLDLEIRLICSADQFENIIQTKRGIRGNFIGILQISGELFGFAKCILVRIDLHERPEIIHSF